MLFRSIEGGAVCCPYREQYDTLYNLKNFGIRSQELTVSIGANAKMNEFQAVMGLCNLKYIDREIQKRKKVIQAYEEILSEAETITLNVRKKEVFCNYAYFPALFENEGKRDHIYDRLMAYGVYSRKYFWPITADAACFKNKYKRDRLENARDLSKRVLTLPVYADLDLEKAVWIAEFIRKEI